MEFKTLDELSEENKEKRAEEILKRPFYKKVWFYLAILFCIMFIFNLKFSIIIVQGQSMEPTYHEGNVRLALRQPIIDRYDAVCIRTNDRILIKRVIGLPGETVEYKDNMLYIDGQAIVDNYNHGKTSDFYVELGDDEYWCLGDNREHSMDSRVYGAFNLNQLLGELIK